MTNAEKFLKESVSVEKFANEIGTLISNGYSAGANRKEFWCVNEVEKWLEKQATPTLTEDERVILRNIDKNFKYIARVNKQIQVCTVKTSNRGLPCDSGYLFTFNHLFQFIKERRRIFY
jgi:hypothetical protein